MRRTSTSRIVVRFCETDLMGVVHHAEYLKYFEIGRIDWLREAGVDFVSWKERGLQFPVVAVEVRFRHPARFDDVLHVETSVLERTRVTVTFRYNVVRNALPICEGSTRLACVNASLRPIAIPSDIAALFDA